MTSSSDPAASSPGPGDPAATVGPRPRARLTSRRQVLGAAVAGAGVLALPGLVRAETVPFVDVSPARQFYDEIMWCRDNDIVTGWPDNTYRPDLPIARDAFCAMLYRFAGSPGFTPPSRSPFSDISRNEYYKEITWAHAEGITDGWPDGTFRPLSGIIRGAVAAMLERLGEGTDVTPMLGAPFRDVRLGYLFDDEVHWVKQNGYLTGWSDGLFRPEEPISREAIAALFHRLSMRKQDGPRHMSSLWSLDRNGASPYTRRVVRPYLLDYQPVDANKILISHYHDQRVLHPVSTAWYSLYQMISYELDRNEERMRRVRASVNHLLANGSSLVDGARWYRYPFAHTPGGLDMGVPWYSGMAQGMMTAVHVRLHEITGAEEHLTYAQQALKSFDRVIGWNESVSGPWATAERDLDGRRLTFFEEYPSRRPDQRSTVVNGHYYALYGIYDAYRLLGTGRALELFRRGAASMREVFPLYRRPGRASWYAVTPWGQRTWGSPTSYHRGVTAQLRIMHELTGDAVFTRQADTLFSDSHLA